MLDARPAAVYPASPDDPSHNSNLDFGRNITAFITWPLFCRQLSPSGWNLTRHVNKEICPQRRHYLKDTKHTSFSGKNTDCTFPDQNYSYVDLAGEEDESRYTGPNALQLLKASAPRTFSPPILRGPMHQVLCDLLDALVVPLTPSQLGKQEWRCCKLSHYCNTLSGVCSFLRDSVGRRKRIRWLFCCIKLHLCKCKVQPFFHAWFHILCPLCLICQDLNVKCHVLERFSFVSWLFG